MKNLKYLAVCMLGLFALASTKDLLAAAPAVAPENNVFAYDATRVEEPALGSFATNGERAITIEYDGRLLELVITPHADLLAGLAPKARDQLTRSGQPFRGTVSGYADSWVRITRTSRGWSGLIYDGLELLAVEPLAALRSGASREQLAVYRALDVPASGTCAVTPENSGVSSMQSMLGEVQALAPTLGAARAQLNVAALLDAQFVQGGDAAGRALARFNAVDGIYSEQVGVAIRISELREVGGSAGLNSSSPQLLLRQLADFAGSSALNNPGLAHLLTGRNLDGNVVGIAYLGQLCQQAVGVGISEIRSGSFAADVVLIAHELGHNFGSPHDNQSGSVCVSTPSGFIMNPSLNGSFDRFSQCSIEQMNREIAGASCLVDLPDPGPGPGPEPSNSCLFSSSFDGDDDGFGFIPDPQDGLYTVGNRVGGSLEVTVGNVDNAVVTRLLGRWRKSCELSAATPVTFTVQARLSQSVSYERNESSTLQLIVNGRTRVLAARRGVGKQGGSAPDRTTGLRTFVVNAELPAGTSRLQLGCGNSQKTARDEVTTCQFAAIEVARQ